MAVTDVNTGGRRQRDGHGGRGDWNARRDRTAATATRRSRGQRSGDPKGGGTRNDGRTRRTRGRGGRSSRRDRRGRPAAACRTCLHL